MDCLILRFDAPLMSFGGVLVDQHNPTDLFPGLAMLTGIFANALGWHHRDFDRLESLQARLRFAARWDVAPERLKDYHTVDLGQDFMTDTGWTTRGSREDRKGDPRNARGTHIRFRHYLASGLMTLAVGLADEGEPSLYELEAVLRTPARPLFLGRKACLPAATILVGRAVLPPRSKLRSKPHRRSRAAPQVTRCSPAGRSTMAKRAEKSSRSTTGVIGATKCILAPGAWCMDT